MGMIFLQGAAALLASAAVTLTGAPSAGDPFAVATAADGGTLAMGKPPRGGGGAHRPAGGGHRPAGGGHNVNRPSGGNHGGGGHRPPSRGGSTVNINHNDVNINRNVHVDNHHGGHHNDHWNDWDDHWHPLETAATVAVTAAVVGSIVRTIPPSCSTMVVNGISYSQCGSTWYQPQYVGSSVQYVVVNPPR
ncbi:hypothetical protein [Novosphingobium clariflavum]|uniref:Uncharacterized protein n=1 Tax=Novosphingobium clariflavum TaxID=2029884 RepID=A0ABV6SAI3_9SPHN|nr:hypothetical protein [Novosphingobium clariflavum]